MRTDRVATVDVVAGSAIISRCSTVRVQIWISSSNECCAAGEASDSRVQLQAALELIAANPSIYCGRICACSCYLHRLILIWQIRMVVLEAVVGPWLLTAMSLSYFIFVLLLTKISKLVEFEHFHVLVAGSV